MKKLFKLSIITAMIFTTLTVAEASVGDVMFGLQLIEYDIEANDWSGRGDKVITSGSTLKPGQNFQVDVLLENVGNSSMTQIPLYIEFDDSLVEPIYFENVVDSENILYEPIDIKDSNMFPKPSRGNPHWYLGTLGPVGGVFPLDFKDTTQKNPITDVSDNRMISLFFRVKTDAPAGSEVKFDFESRSNFSSGGAYFLRDGYKRSPIKMTVAGETAEENNTLSNLSIKGTVGGTQHEYLEGMFVESQTKYEIAVPSHLTSLNFNHTLEDPASGTIVSHGKVNASGGSMSGMSLTTGDNYFKTVVKNSSDQPVKEINYTVRRLSSNTDITVSGTDNNGSGLIFDASNNTTVLSNALNVDLSINNHNSGSESVVSSDETTISGKNVTILTSQTKTPFRITVTPEDALEKYNTVPGINFNRGTSVVTEYTLERASDDNSLKEVIIKNTIGKTELKKWTETLDSYDLEVDNSITSVDVELTPNHAGASVIPPGVMVKALTPGINTFKVDVNAPDGSKKTYTFNINRVPRTNAGLTSLSVKVDGIEKNPNVNQVSDVTAIELDFKKDYLLDLTAVANTTEGAKLISGNLTSKALSEGLNTFKIVVQAEDKSTKEYTVNITVKDNSNSELEGGLSPNVPVGDDNWLTDPDKPIEDNSTPNEKDDVDPSVSIYRHTINVVNEKKLFSRSDLNLNVPTNSVLSGDESIDLSVGDNTFTFEVKSQDGSSTSRYIITVVRAKSTLASLDSLTMTSIPQGTLTGNQLIGYTYKVSADVESFNIQATGLNGSVVDGSTIGHFDITTNPQTQIVKVTSEDGSSTKDITIKIERAQSTNATLGKFEVSYGSIVRDNILSSFVNQAYTLEVEKGIESIEIYPQTVHGTSSFTINNTSDASFDLKPGVNVFNVVVMAESGTQAGYTFTVNRAMNNDANLNSISIDSNLISGWNTDTFEYTLPEVGEDVSTLDLTYVTRDSNAKAVIVGNTLKHGDNVVEIVVTAQDGKTVVTYRLNVYRALSSSADLGDGGIIPGDSNQNDSIDKDDSTPYHYNVYVPFGTKTYGKEDFVLDLTTGSIAKYDVDAITVTGNPVNDKYKFIVVAPDGVTEQEYVITVNVMDSAIPRLLTIAINGVEYTKFDPNNLSTVIPLDGLIPSDSDSFKFTVTAPSGTTVSPTIIADIVVTGKSLIEQQVTLTRLNDAMIANYIFKFTRTLSSDNTLEDIVIDDGSIELFPSIKDDPNGPYEVSVPGDKDKIEINPDPSNPNSSIKGDGSYDLIPGKNKITITVEAEDGSGSKDYEIIVYREIELNELVLGTINVDVANGVLSENGKKVTYTVSEDIDQDKIEAFVKAVANHPTVKITGNANKDVVLDNSDIVFLLTAQDGESTLEVILKYNRSLNSDASLSELVFTIDGTEVPLNFEKDTLVYDVEVDHTFLELVRDTHLTWKTTHPNTTVDIPEKLTIKNTEINKLLINTSAEDGSALIYTINIKRGSNNALESLKIATGEGHLEQTFDPEKLDYSALIYSGATSFSFEWTTPKGVSVVNAAALKNIPVSSLPTTIKIEVKGDNDDIRTYLVEVNVGVSTRLASMESSHGVLSFMPDTLSYTVLVDQDSTEVSLVNVVAEDVKATVVGNYTNIPLTDDETGPISIKVQNGGYESEYLVTFIKTADQTGIGKVVVNDGPNRWESTLKEDGTFEIIVNSDTKIEDLEIDVILSVPGGSYEISEGIEDDEENMNYVITVTDKNGIKKDYDLVIKNDDSDNNYLKELTIMGEKVAGFNRWATDYEYKLTSTDPVNVNGIPEDEKATVAYVIPEPLIDGSVIKVTVTSAKGTPRTYSIKVQKDKENTAVLSHLSVKEAVFSPKFNANQSQYYMTIPFELDSLTVSYLAENGGTASIESNATVKDQVISGFDVGEGNRIDVIVEAQDGTEFTYTIHVTRSPESNNYLDSLSVKETGTDRVFNLSPAFSKDKLSYTVTLPRDANAVTVEGEFADSLSAHGIGDIVLTQFPFTHEVRVLDQKNISRIYYITFLQEASEIVTLADLRTSEGALDPVFDANRFVYNIDVPYSVTSLELLYTTNADDQIVEGAGLKELKTGRNEFVVTVKSGSSSQNYTIFVNRAKVSTPGLDWLEVSDGTLSPEFNPKVNKYHVSVDESVENVTINAGSHSDQVVVEGSGDKALNPGSNVFEIKVDAGAEVYETYYVVVYRGEVAEDNLLLAHLSITNETLDEEFDPLLNEYSATLSEHSYDVLDVIALAQNPKATVSLLGNTNLANGESLVTVRVSLSETVFADTTIRVTIGMRLLESNIHEVGETYIATVGADQTVKDLKDQMLNDNQDLRVYSEGEEMTDDELVGTGAIIKLVVDLKEYDSKIIVVLGDVNGDGEISIADRMMTQNKVLGGELTTVEMLAADVTLDTEVSIADYMMIQSHILQQLDIHKPQEVTINE